MRFKPILFVLGLLATCVIGIHAYGVYWWGSSAYGLIVVTSLSEEDISFDPLSKNAMYITPNVSAWLLTSFEYPYVGCRGVSRVANSCEQPPLLVAAGALHDATVDGRDISKIKRLSNIMSHLLKRGEDVNEVYKGMTLVHYAILFKDDHFMNLLLSNGADLNARVRKPDEEYNNLNSYELIEFYEKKNRNMKGINEVIESYSNKA